MYPAMEDFVIDVVIGKGANAKSIRLDLPKFTLVGATTRAGMMTAPLRDRFGVINRLEFYNIAELESIIKRSAKVLKVDIDEEGSLEIARRSRGTPRIANRLLKRVRDYSVVADHSEIELSDAKGALSMLEIDELGLDYTDIRLMRSMAEKFRGGPCGLDTVAAMINEDANTIEDVYEPYLLQLGFISRTPRGRILTEAGYEHIGLKKD